MLIVEMAKIELAGGHIGFIFLYRLPEWNSNYANYRDGQNRNNWRKYWIYCIYIDYQNEIRIMLIIKMAKIELIGGHIGFFVFI